MYRESKIANSSSTLTIVIMKLSSNTQSAPSYILINFKPYKAISAIGIEPSSFEFQKFPTSPVFEKVHFLLHFKVEVSHRYILLKFYRNPSTGCEMLGAQSFQQNRK